MSIAASTQDRIEAEAADWLAAVECGTADRQAFEQWRAGSPAHALAFLRVAQVASALDRLRETGMGDPPPPSEAAREQPVAGRRQFLAFGAFGMLGAGLAGLGWTFAAAAHEAGTGVGERRRIVVAEGIGLDLNTDSLVRWRQRGVVFEIELLRGEVMLERRQSGAPCRLDCADSRIDLAAGGRMVARSKPRGVDLAVLEGEAYLRTTPVAAPVRIASLRKASVIGGMPSLSPISQREAGAVSAWQQGQLQFNGERLRDAVVEYNRYLSRPIEIADPSIGELRLGGRFSATNPADFFRALEQIYGLSARPESARILLLRDRPKKLARL